MALPAFVILAPGRSAAQTGPEQAEFRRQFYGDYSRWSVGATAGISVVWGDFRSFADEKTYIGSAFGLDAAYQISPTFGLRLGGIYSMNKAGATDDNKDYILERDGFTYYGVTPPADALTYGELYSKIDSWQVGLNVDVNVSNLLRPNDGLRDRRWTVLASPGFYMQYFRPKVYVKGGGRYTTGDLYYAWKPGVGGDATLIYKASQTVDLKLRATGIWISNEKFDGVASGSSRKQNGYSNLTAGISFKFGARAKADHLMYAPARKYVRAPQREVVNIVNERITVEQPVDVGRIVDEVTKAIGENSACCLEDLPSVYFKRGSTVIDEVKYARELHDILSVLAANPDLKFQIWGYADHTGGEEINDSISYGRAESLRDYLLRNGVAASRIVKIAGMGKDPRKEGETALSEVARSAEIVKE